jgi:hypothetical protein
LKSITLARVERDQADRLVEALASAGFHCMLNVKREAGNPVHEVQVTLDGLESADLPRLMATIGERHGYIVGGTMEIS